jgi:ParB family chromosome partitioning protein
LLAISDRSRQEELARRAVHVAWTVRAVEQAVRAESTSAPDDTAPTDSTPGGPTIDGAGLSSRTSLRPPGLLELEELLASHLDTRVAVSMTAKKGRVSIDFADLEDLERIYRRITQAG